MGPEGGRCGWWEKRPESSGEGWVGLPGELGLVHTRVYKLCEFEAQALLDFAHFPIHGEGLYV